MKKMNENIMEELENKESNVNISNDVVAAIAGIAAAEVEGVAGMTGGMASDFAHKLGVKKSPQKGVKVNVTPEGAEIDVLINVAFGVRIPELAWEVQENVKNSVESMTGLDVLKVNVFVEGVSFEKKKKAPKAEEIIDDEEDVIEVESSEETE